jgi:phosphinothricin acetyltransferase
MRERSPAALRFEPMAEKYLPEVLAIYNDYVVNTTVTFHIKPLTMDEMRTLVFHPDPRHATFVIILDGAVIGYVGLSAHHLREAYRDTADIAVYIKKENRGAGIGEAAVRFIEKYAKERGFRALIAAISGENTRSIALFRRLGYFQCAHYRKVGEKFGRLLDVIDFEKLIGEDAVNE